MTLRRRRTVAAGLAGLGAVAVAALRGRLRRFVIAEHSMTPTLRPGDYVVATRAGRRLDRGDVVVFADERDPGFELVKRVVGLPAERVSITGGQVHIGDAPLAEPWADGPTLPDGSWQLAPDEVFVLGDARSLSTGDSRSLGPIPVDAVGWKVVFRYWPPSGVGRV